MSRPGEIDDPPSKTSMNTVAQFFALLRRNRDYRRLFFASLVSYMGDWFAFVAVSGFVTDVTRRGGLAAIVYAASVLPVFFLSPLAGVIADRMDRRRMLVSVDVIRVPTIPGTRDYQWILSVPLFDQPGGAAVGVIGFAAEGAAHTRAGNALAAFARRTARRVWESEDDGASTSEQFNDLWNCVNAALWTGPHEVIEDHDDLFDPDVQAMVRQCYETWVSVAASDEHR